MPNNNILPVPHWLNKAYIENALNANNSGSPINLIDCKISAATKKGENYASVLFRANLKFFKDNKNNHQTQSYVIKISFEENEFVNKLFAEYPIYTQEMNVYKNVFPKFKSIFKNLPSFEQFYPEAHFVDYEHNAIVFEDLLVKNFLLPNRYEGLDIVHTKMVLKSIARMHAATAVLNEIQPNFFKKFDRGLFNRYTNSLSSYYLVNLDICIELTKNWENYEQYSKKLLKLKPHLMEYGKRVFDPNPDHFNTLIHGDLWIMNMMFRYDDSTKEPIDVVLFDYQFAAWTSPAVDLHYFFNTSLNEDLRLHHQDKLVQYYHNNLVESLTAWNYKGKIPTLQKFWCQFMDKSFYAFTSGCIIQPVILNENNEKADIYSLVGGNERAIEFKTIVYNNEKVQNNLKTLLPIFDRKGLLDLQD